MVDAVCSKCDVGWVIHSHDKHCGYCGCKVFDFSVTWEQEPRIYAGDGANIHDLTILVENTGAYPITFQPIRTTPDNTILFPQETGSPFKVNAGQRHPIPIQVNPTNLARHAETITVRAQDAPPNLVSEKLLHLKALPRPDFKLTPNPVKVRHRRGTEKVREELHLEVQQSQFYISDIKATGGSVLSVGYSKQLHQNNNAFKKVILEIDCNRLTDEPNVVKLNFELRGLSQPIEKRIEIQREIVPDPPRLFVPQMNPEVTQERKKTHSLTLQNIGERTLRVQNIVCRDPSNLIQLPNLEYPINIEGGGHQNIEMQLLAVDVEPGDHTINFTINSNCEADPQYQYVLNVTVKQREEYPYYLAIDFGTTNSCCAYIDKNYNVKLLPLDTKANLPEIMPSSIIYRSQSTEETPYHIGYDAETDRTSVRDGPYYVSSVKRWLGFRWHRKFPNNQEYQPLDVVSHILKHIINEAEDYLEQQGIESKITKCVITYPTMFTPEQQDDLRQAFENIGISELILIDEASAASMGIIFESDKTLQEDYRLLVYDFGGGTIDIVLSQVTIDGSDIAIEPIARDGERQYGGDDVTQAIVDFVLKEYGGRIERGNPGLNFEIPYFEPGRILQPTGNQEVDEATRRNAATLYRRAEEMKKELNTQPETEFFSSLEVVVGGSVRNLQELIENDLSMRLSARQFRSFIEPALKKTFEKIDAMVADNDARLPNAVVLAGQSSKMQLVKNLMAAHFRENYQEDIEIHLDEHPKTCVVMGAAQYGLTRSLPVEEAGIQVVQLANKTLSRLGITRQKLGRPVFGEIIPKGKLIPKESVDTTDCRFQSRTPFIEVHEHFEADDDIQKASLIAGYTLNLPRNVSDQALREARLKMAVKTNGEIELAALVGGDEYTFTVKKQKPEFVENIY
jgi:molecular chaperone DnaK (HSP70)